MKSLLRCSCLFVILPIALLANASTVEFSNLITSPHRYNCQRISLVGFAHVSGESFVLYQNDKEAAKLSTSRAVSIAQKRRGPNHNRVNDRWVTVTGIVDANSHGLWNFPCEILLENVELIDRPSKK